MPTRKEFAAQIKAKYPVYKDIPDDQLVDTILQKFPVYRSSVVDFEGSPGPEAGIVNERGETVQPGRNLPGSDAELNSLWWGAASKSLGLDKLFDMARIEPSPTGSRMENLEQIMPFLLPTGIAGAGSAANNLKAQLGEVGLEAEGLRKQGVGRFKSYAKALGDRMTDTQTSGERRLQREPFRWVQDTQSTPPPEPGSAAPTRTGPPTGGTENMSDLPLWKQQMLMDEAGSAGSTGSTMRTQEPPYQPKPEPTEVGRLTGRKSPTQADQLQDILEELMPPEDPRLSSLPPEPDLIGGGSMRQSGKFKRADSLGQPGGYSSGRPGITQELYDELDPAAIGARERTAGGVSVDPEAAVSKYTNKDRWIPPAQEQLFKDMGMTPEEIRSMTPEQADSIFNSEWKNQPPERLGSGGTELDTTNPAHMDALKGTLDDQLLIELDPGGMAQRAQDLRTNLGSRDAAREMFGTANPTTQGYVRQMAPGPSRIPLEAEERLRKAGFDPLVGLLMAGLGGHTMSGLWDEP